MGCRGFGCYIEDTIGSTSWPATQSGCLLQEWAKNTMAGRMSKSDKLGAVDHSKIDYPPFRRNFYIEVQELQKMSEEDVAKHRKELDDIKVSHQACLAVIVGLL